MRQQSYLLYDDSNELWSKLKSDMLNPTVSSFIDMDKPGAITLSDADDLLQFQISKGAPLFSSLFDFAFSHQINDLHEKDDSSVVLRVETSRNTDLSMGQDTLEMLESSGFQYSLEEDNSLMQQEGEQQQGLVFDNIDLADVGYDMMDYDFDKHQQQDISAILNEPSAVQQEAQGDSVFDFPLSAADLQLRKQQDARTHYLSPLNQARHAFIKNEIASFGPIRNASEPPSLIQEEDEEYEQDNLSFSSISTSNLSTILPIEAITEVQATGYRARRMKRMVLENTVLSYANDYTTDRIMRAPIQLHVANLRRETKKQRLARIRTSLRHPSIVFSTVHFNGVLSTEQGVGAPQSYKQNQELAFFNRSRLFVDQIERSRRYDHYRARNTSGSTVSQFNVPGIRQLSHQAPSSGGISIRSNSDVHNTPEMHNLDLDGDMELERVQEENTGIWQQEHQFQPIGDDDMMDYGGDAIDFDMDLNVGFSDDLLQQQQQQTEEEMHKFMEHIKQLPNPFNFNQHFQPAHSCSLVAKSFTNILELASKNQIRVSQTEPYAPIEIHYLF
ncbi:hypothetical protein HMPREF1544_07331 [Mucor circinelloides 1006PhL]|uniref:Rad21/Rec8-like protein C-terminal eukaryotic domain-containing protein n=1 Tax=Mucor circinelloides f. circinelloides (strain 1006PhL) TaxID=1220926 RepID=S2K1A0_MUCC1|nr:hypothetical protein HMPREF1544_07331 [Mucor circinelloides 1006PhL]